MTTQRKGIGLGQGRDLVVGERGIGGTGIGRVVTDVTSSDIGGQSPASVDITNDGANTRKSDGSIVEEAPLRRDPHCLPPGV